MIDSLRIAARMARKNPGTTLAAFLALALGIGSSTAIFSVVDSVLLKPLPVRDGDRLVRIYATDSHGPEEDLSMADYLDWKKSLHSFSAMALYRTRQATYSGDSVPDRVITLEVEADLLPLLGVSPLLGRGFNYDVNQPGQAHEAILTWPYWQTHFGGRNILGKRIILDQQGFTIIGILPKSFTVFGHRDLLLPVIFDLSKPENKRGYHGYEAIARLAPGISITQANAELASGAALLAHTFPKENQDVSARAQDLRSTLAGEGIGASQKHVRFALLVLLAAGLSVLAIACTNVAHIQLIRAWSRQREMAIRSSLGATRTQLFRQVLSESLWLSLAGAAAGLAVALGLIRLFRHLPINAIPRLEETTLDWRVLLFALLIGILAGIGFGIAPALRSTRLDLNSALKESGTRSTASRAQLRLRQLLVVLEIAVSMALLVECALLAKSFVVLMGLQPAFAREPLLTFYLSLPPTRYNTRDVAASTARLNALLKTLQSTPGITTAAMTSDLPLSSTVSGGGMVFEDKQLPHQFWRAPYVVNLQVSESYFRTLGIPLLAGRLFAEREQFERIVLVNHAFANRFYPGQSAVGHRIANAVENPRWQEIIGVVGDVPEGNIEDKVSPQVYFPLMIPVSPWVAVAVRAQGDPATYLDRLRAQIAKADPSVAVFLPRTMQQIRDKQFFWRKLQTWLLGTFAFFALLLASLGIYAVIAYTVRQRTNEIGVRMALGASSGQVWTETLWQGLRPVIAGLIGGVILAWAGARLTSSLFFAAAPSDLAAYLATIGFILLVAIVASAIPATRASRIEPARALHHE
jgi:putative ABC transport system permease protein